MNSNITGQTAVPDLPTTLLLWAIYMGTTEIQDVSASNPGAHTRILSSASEPIIKSVRHHLADIVVIQAR